MGWAEVMLTLGTSSRALSLYGWASPEAKFGPSIPTRHPRHHWQSRSGKTVIKHKTRPSSLSPITNYLKPNTKNLVRERPRATASCSFAKPGISKTASGFGDSGGFHSPSTKTKTSNQSAVSSPSSPGRFILLDLYRFSWCLSFSLIFSIGSVVVFDDSLFPDLTFSKQI